MNSVDDNNDDDHDDHDNEDGDGLLPFLYSDHFGVFTVSP